MSTANKLLDKYAAVCGTSQDKELAIKLRVSKGAVSNWRHGRAQPNAEAVERMCSAINEPLRAWLPLIEAERARTPGDRKVWLRLAQAAASFAMIYAFSRLNVHEGIVSALVLASRNPGTLYIM
ncbi:hypothetical protein GCM10008098_11840 [Rhodanobacter panaciterrae]|uniref:HTH cro/C1-type domain-containing protein n=1 Tax=Rhodanobacter panaciterrae TaxID=490572 RepID=A0ABQ2ZQA2_9GAMM|nr:helix-turn-helix transcriptional regulator [Rhodanobacter panaciterrae]GGY20818.1 hypothetical protein GCM10008098_11840 [Rhodanobacter panaciterrae]